MINTSNPVTWRLKTSSLSLVYKLHKILSSISEISLDFIRQSNRYTESKRCHVLCLKDNKTQVLINVLCDRYGIIQMLITSLISTNLLPPPHCECWWPCYWKSGCWMNGTYRSNPSLHCVHSEYVHNCLKTQTIAIIVIIL